MILVNEAYVLAAYALGSIPFGYLLARANSGMDIRTLGSGNIGATNVLRTQGKWLGILTLILDFSKAALPVWAAGRLGLALWVPAAAGGAAVVGHCFPFTIKFRGGKGIASALGAFLFIAPAPTLFALGVFLVEALTMRTISLGSILASLVFTASILVLHFAAGWYTLTTAIVGAAIGLLLVARHHANIRDLLNGTESRVWGKGSDQ